MDANHLDLTDELIKAVILNANTTQADFTALYNSICNHRDYGKDHEFAKIVLLVKADLQDRVNRGMKEPR